MAHREMASATVQKREMGKKMLEHLKVIKGKGDSGHVIEHHYENGGMGMWHKPDVVPFGADQGKEALAHIASAVGIKMDAEEKGESPKEEKAEMAKGGKGEKEEEDDA